MYAKDGHMMGAKHSSLVNCADIVSKDILFFHNFYEHIVCIMI